MIDSDTNANIYGSVYQVLEEVNAGRSLPTGTHGSMFRAIDALRRCAAPAEHIKLAESIAVSLHKLAWALRSRTEADEKAARDELQVASGTWLETPLRLTLN